MAQGAGVDATIHDVDLELGTTWDTLGNTEILGVLDDEIEDEVFGDDILNLSICGFTGRQCVWAILGTSTFSICIIFVLAEILERGIRRSL